MTGRPSWPEIMTLGLEIRARDNRPPSWKFSSTGWGFGADRGGDLVGPGEVVCARSVCIVMSRDEEYAESSSFVSCWVITASPSDHLLVSASRRALHEVPDFRLGGVLEALARLLILASRGRAEWGRTGERFASILFSILLGERLDVSLSKAAFEICLSSGI